MRKPSKPHRDFPLFPHANGQWAKKFCLNGKPSLRYFGRWMDDLKGQRALADYLARKDAILAGLDNLRVNTATNGMMLGELMGKYLERRRTDMLAGELSPRTYGDYLAELQAFVNVTGAAAQVAALRPEHFAAYHKNLIEQRKLGRHARKRVIAYIKAMLNWGAGNGYYPAPTYGNEFTAPDTRPHAMRQAKAREGREDHSSRILTGEELEKLINAANPQFKAIILLGVNCGLGPADIGRLQWRNIDKATGQFDMPRPKTGTLRHGYLWKRTRKALTRVAKLKHNRTALEREGQKALVFLTRKGLPVYREREIIKDGVSAGVQVEQIVSNTFGKLTKALRLEGVTFYRLRHTFKTLGKKARDRDALNLMMGHREGSTGEVYDHEEIEFARIKRVALVVYRQLWPKQKREASTRQRQRRLRLVGGSHVADGERAA